MTENFGGGMVKNECGQSGDRALKLNVSEEWVDGITDFLHVGTDSQRLNANQIFFRRARSKVNMASLVMGL